MLGNVDVRQVKVAQGAFYSKAVLANGIPMHAACDERHIVSSRGHPRTEVPSDGSRGDDGNSHYLFPGRGLLHPARVSEQSPCCADPMITHMAAPRIR